MKNVIQVLIAAVLVAGLSLSATAQDQGHMRIPAGLQYTFDGGNIGFGAGFEYFIMDPLSGQAAFYFTPKDGASYTNFDLDAKYYFLKDNIQMYGMAGLGFSGFDSGSEIGLNLGGGAVYPLSDKLGLQGELRYNTSAESGILRLGVTIGLN